jgi:hypothetical protein
MGRQEPRMPHPPSPGIDANGSMAGLFRLSDAPEPFRLDRPSLGDRELTLKVHQIILAPAANIRRKIWEFDTNLHCSIIGTCLTTSELRRALGKLGCGDSAAPTEHEVHAKGVRTASRRHDGAKLLHKALDRRHRIAINRFGKARTADEVQALWRDAVQQGDIPGAYWATLTHPATNDAVVRAVFTEVHMLSHLVGAANRADIRRLRQLEDEKAELEAKVERQQRQLRDTVVLRDGTIRDLTRALEERIARDHGTRGRGEGCRRGGAARHRTAAGRDPSERGRHPRRLAKGCGEAGCAGSLPAVMNAVVDALAQYGIRHIDMPATPFKVWQAIQEARVAECPGIPPLPLQPPEEP